MGSTDWSGLRPGNPSSWLRVLVSVMALFCPVSKGCGPWGHSAFMSSELEQGGVGAPAAGGGGGGGGGEIGTVSKSP